MCNRARRTLLPSRYSEARPTATSVPFKGSPCIAASLMRNLQGPIGKTQHHCTVNIVCSYSEELWSSSHELGRKVLDRNISLSVFM